MTDDFRERKLSVMREPNDQVFYFAQDGPLGTVTVKEVADYSQSLEAVAYLASNYPQIIYFGVPA